MENPNPPLLPLPLPNSNFEIKVVFNPATGQVSVAGPMELKGFCIKALSVALQIIVDYDNTKVVKANGHS